MNKSLPNSLNVVSAVERFTIPVLTVLMKLAIRGALEIRRQAAATNRTCA